MGIIAIILGVAFVIGFSFLGVWAIMLLLNWAFGLFGLGLVLTYWQTYGVCFLITLLGNLFHGIRVKINCGED